jgi:hypothetical protein
MIARPLRAYGVALSLVVLAPTVVDAHVGSPDVIFDGKAGPYDLRVIVRVPMVVPGLADVSVRVLSGDVQRVLIRPVFWRAGVAGSPSPDAAKPVAGTSRLYAGHLWLMARGAYSVYVSVEGASGTGTVSVPVMSVATGRLRMSAGLRAILATLGILLAAGLITIVYAGAGESVVEAGETFDKRRRRRARSIGLVAAPIVALALFGGAKWWRSVDTLYQTRMYRPLATRASIRREGPRPILRFVVVDSSGRAMTLDPLVPDHGKLMHLFAIDSATMTSFAHLHPLFDDTATFATPVPPLPPGVYRLFGDVTFETGQTRTLTGTVTVTHEDSVLASSARADPDDAWINSFGAKRVAGSTTVDTLANEITMQWLADSTPIRANEETTLRFRVRDKTGALASLEPYLGMAAHAAITRTDGSVFIHLHPAGTISLAAQQVFALRDRGDTTAKGRLRITGETTSHVMPMAGEFGFPYIFPRTGPYRIWVQVKHDGRVLTGVFELVV